MERSAQNVVEIRRRVIKHKGEAMEYQIREQALLEVLRQGLFAASQKSGVMLGDRSLYIGLSELAKYAECPRAAIASKLAEPSGDFQKLISAQRGHWFEQGLKDVLHSAGLMPLHQLEINVRRKSGVLKAHLDFTLVWEKPVQAVRILEIKSTGNIPDSPRPQHLIQAQGQADLLRRFWNKPVFALRNENGEVLQEKSSFSETCAQQLNLRLPAKPGKISVESWLLYVSMREVKAYGPYVHQPETLERLLNKAEAFHADLKKARENALNLNKLDWPKGFYPLCDWCDFNSDCPKFRQGAFQPQWEPAIRKLEELKRRQESIRNEISEIENALKQAHQLSETKDWVDTGEHRFRLSTVAGRKSLNQAALKDELAETLHALNSDIKADELIESCMKQGAPFPRLTISPIRQ